MSKTANRKKIKVQVPSFFRKKVFMVTMLLLCSGVLAIVATYAWFILATAPEVTGITTTVGSNGSLEMALLDSTTFSDTTKIQAGIGDSMDAEGKSAVESNVTWGNLVDLSDASYGLSSITLNPSTINSSSDKIDLTNLLLVAHNGTDGRIKSVTADTIAATFNSANSSFTSSGSGYGVRAVGKADSASASGRSGAFSSAKSAVTSNTKTATSTATNAIANNGDVFVDMLTSSSGTYTYSQVEAMKNVVDGMYNSLNYVYTAYKNAIIAAAASTSDEAYNLVKSSISTNTDVTLSAYTNYFINVGISTTDLSGLADAINKATSAKNAANALLYDEEGDPKPSTTTFTSADISALKSYIYSGGTIDKDTYTVTGDASNGLVTAVAQYVGSYSVTVNYTGAVKVEATIATTVNNGKGLLANVDVSKLTAPPTETATTTTGSTTLTTFYGYVIDLAFRTNTASELQLQSDAINRIYTDGSDGTAGGGSSVIFNYTEGMTNKQVENMLNAVRVIFFDPDSGTIYGTAQLGSVVNDGTTATATLSMTSGASTITTLEVATPKKLSALIYLDGEVLDNTSVMNADSSGTLTLNLQFSSSADLKPMEDSEVKSAS